jgi:hypothetical protein
MLVSMALVLLTRIMDMGIGSYVKRAYLIVDREVSLQEQRRFIMKRNLIMLIGAAFILTTTGGSMAEDMPHDMGHRMPKEETGHGMPPMGAGNENGMAMGHSSHSGDNIHDSVVEGHRFSYYLIDIREKMAAMKAAGHAYEGMDATHHLMVYIENPEGVAVENANVGYLVEGPDGSTQKRMCMGMGGGYGSDVNFADSGDYVIKTEATANREKLIDDFTYTVK